MRLTRILPLTACALAMACAPQPDTVDEPDPELLLLGGYRSTDDDCRLTGESSFTVEFLDDAADLVTCPTSSDAAASLVAMYPATLVTQTTTYSLYSVARR